MICVLYLSTSFAQRSFPYYINMYIYILYIWTYAGLRPNHSRNCWGPQHQHGSLFILYTNVPSIYDSMVTFTTWISTNKKTTDAYAYVLFLLLVFWGQQLYEHVFQRQGSWKTGMELMCIYIEAYHYILYIYIYVYIYI